MISSIKHAITRFALTSTILVFVYLTRGNGPDFMIYYYAALGDLSFTVKHYHWVYKDWLAYVFWPATLLPYSQAVVVWYVVQIACCAIMSYKIRNFYAYLLCLPGFVFCILAGNVYPLLALACFSPWGIVLASLVKPQLLGVGIVMALARIYRARHPRPALD